MSRLGVTLRLEARLQWRYRFLHLAALSGVLWLALLLPLPPDLRSIAEPYVILGDLAIVGFFFIAGAVFFERDERTLHALVSTPLRFREYLAAKVVTLTVLSVLIAVVVATVTHGAGYGLVWLLLGATLGTVLMLLLGFITSMPFTSISDFWMAGVVPLALFNLPVFHFSGAWPTPWLYLIPTQGPLMFLGAAFDQTTLAAWQVAYGIGYPVLFAMLMSVVARRMFDRFVVARKGGA